MGKFCFLLALFSSFHQFEFNRHVHVSCRSLNWTALSLRKCSQSINCKLMTTIRNYKNKAYLDSGHRSVVIDCKIHCILQLQRNRNTEEKTAHFRNRFVICEWSNPDPVSQSRSPVSVLAGSGKFGGSPGVPTRNPGWKISGLRHCH